MFITSILGSIAAHHKSMFDEKRKSSHVGYLPYSASKVTIYLLSLCCVLAAAIPSLRFQPHHQQQFDNTHQS